jgi:RimJ/RimL family protein N-acetyltransferase
MSRQPELTTERLVLRPFTLADAPSVQRLAGDMAVASTTGRIPHPYEDGLAEEWISTHQQAFEEDKEAVFAITLKADGTLIGCVGLTINRDHERAVLGYWIGKPYWSNGYCTEAAAEVVRYGFTELGLNRIWATHFPRNPASGRVMAKIGMTHEGCWRQHFRRWGVLEDLELYAILKSEYETRVRL